MISSRCSRSTRRAARPAASTRASERRSWRSSRAPSSCTASSPAARRPASRPAPRIASRTSSSRGGSRSSSGARARRGAAHACGDGPAARAEGAMTQQVRRMLADPRSESLVTNFAFQWLGVRRLDAMDPDPRAVPDIRRGAARRVSDGDASCSSTACCATSARACSISDSADYTFVNERLARHYGIAGVRGAQFRRVHLDDPRRCGLLGKGSVLMVSSYPDRTSPVLRGAWIMEEIVGTPPQPPPPGSRRTCPRSTRASRYPCVIGSRATARSRRATSATA